MRSCVAALNFFAVCPTDSAAAPVRCPEGLGEADVPVCKYLIERLRTRSDDVRPQNQAGEGSIALAKNLSIGQRENGRRTSRLSGTSSLPGRTLLTNDRAFFDGF